MWVAVPHLFFLAGGGPRPLGSTCIPAATGSGPRLHPVQSKPIVVNLVFLTSDWLRGGHVTLSWPMRCERNGFLVSKKGYRAPKVPPSLLDLSEVEGAPVATL